MEQQSQLERLGLFDARVPRYTSYPTAPHFSPAVGEAQFRDWLAAVPAGGQISLYLHVPFCRRLCWFCACRTQGTQSEDPVRAYAEDLIREIALLKAALAPGVRLSRLHWGGGTPTLLPADAIARLADAVLTAFPLAEDAEFSVEIDPNEIASLRAELGALADTQPTEQLDALLQKRQSLINVLQHRLDAGELTYARFLGTSQQVFSSALDKLHEVGVAAESTGRAIASGGDRALVSCCG